MKTTRWMATLALAVLGAAPATAQQRQQGGERPTMGSGMMQMCHMMEGGDATGRTMMRGQRGMPGHGQMMGTGMMAGGMMGAGMMGDAEMMGGGMMGMGMMGMMGTSPAALLGAADRLELTPEQTSRLEELAQRAEQDLQQHMQPVMDAHARAAEALQGEAPDLQAYEQALHEASGRMVQAHVAAARTAVEAREVLTPEQREQVQESAELMGQMVCGQMMHGQQGGPPQPRR